MNENLLSKLHDIKELEKIPDYSIFILILLVFLGILFCLLVLFFLIKFIKNKKNTPRKKYLKILKEIDFDDSKKSAYTLSKYARLLAINDREKKLANELIEELEKFKYKKNVGKIDNHIKAKYSIFMESLDV
ncbi:hypothetical protein [Arcobacter aquimarinus]|uniref:DUF4381 domain-containing protein n=1 Tax=Arcobacter aquimarinus TaxID=1315211 RepID=A0AAE7B1N4_9BACT|nr:hypothetical protein [Arcobacter aquimarinus]QKE25336.1 hypothetical protein AAQM_0571 [Arcobacter aquimarinus]RXI31218.1 hypothetical protein CP986_11575 [Arcobacter aquimarinus]